MTCSTSKTVDARPVDDAQSTRFEPRGRARLLQIEQVGEIDVGELVGSHLVAQGRDRAGTCEAGVDPSRVYYGTDTRAIELLMGAALAMVLSRPGWVGSK